MTAFKFKYQLYKHLQANSSTIYAEARKAAEEIGITPDMKGNIGLTGAVSGCHGLLSREVDQAITDAARKVIPSAVYDEKIREIVKEFYGDEYDAALINTCEAGLNVAYDTLCMPPTLGRGDRRPREPDTRGHLEHGPVDDDAHRRRRQPGATRQRERSGADAPLG